MEVSTRSTRIGDILSFVFQDRTEYEQIVQTLQHVQEDLRQTDVEGYVALKHILNSLEQTYSMDERYHQGLPSALLKVKDVEELGVAFFALDGFIQRCEKEMQEAQKALDSQDASLQSLQDKVQEQAVKQSVLEQKLADQAQELERYHSPSVQAVLKAKQSPFKTSNG